MARSAAFSRSPGENAQQPATARCPRSTEAHAVSRKGKCPEFQIKCVSKRAQEEPVMITSHPDALTKFGFVCLIIP